MSPSSESLDAFPLAWPDRYPRRPVGERVVGAFKVSFVQAHDDLVYELARLGAEGIVISSNVPVRRDGLPLSRAREPVDPGVAVYFDWKKRPYVFACDNFDRVTGNLRAIGLTISSIRAIARYGATEMMEQAFTGFAALPPANHDKPWWEVLGVSDRATEAEVKIAFRELMKIHHPDRDGGDQARAAEVNRARDRALADIERRQACANGSA